jgi:serine/alanine adding enzyme
MNFEVQIITDIDRPITEFLNSHPEGNFFQSSQIFDFYKCLPGYEPFMIEITGDDLRICGALMAVIFKGKGISGFFSNRCIITGGPLISGNGDNEREILKLLLDKLNDFLKKKAIYIEFRNLMDRFDLKSDFESKGYTFTQHLNYGILIDNKEALFSKIKKSKQRQITKGLERGAVISELTEKDELVAFYRILQGLYSSKVLKPLPGFQFFEAFNEYFNDGKNGVILAVKYMDEVIGGIICPIYRQEVIYEWYIGSLNKKYKKFYPGVLATWAAIQFAADNEIKYFDLMGAGEPGKYYGVRNFKLDFGGDLFNFGRFIKVNKPILYAIGKTGLKILPFLKLAK